MALDDKQEADLKAKLAEFEAKAKEADALKPKLSALESEKKQLVDQIASKDREAVTNRIKAEFPHLAEMIGDVIPVSNYETMKTVAEKIAAKVGTPKPNSQTAPRTFDAKQPLPADATAAEKELWTKAGGIAANVDTQVLVADQEARKSYADLVKAGNANGVIDTLLKRHAPKVSKFFKVS